MDHSALFRSVKDKDVEQLHKVLGPTLHHFGSYQIVHWDHAADGILTSLNKIPGVQGYECLRWAEKVVNDSHQSRSCNEADSCYAEYVYRLRADLLGKALERITYFKPAERPAIWKEVASAIVALGDEATEENLLEQEWLSRILSKVTEEGLKHVG